MLCPNCLHPKSISRLRLNEDAHMPGNENRKRLPLRKPVISESAGSKFSHLAVKHTGRPSGVMFAAGWVMGNRNAIHYHKALPHSRGEDGAY